MSIPSSLSQTLITGVYRSGTEYITQLANCHPHLSATMYRVNVLRFVAGRFDPIESEENYSKALDAIKARVQKRYKISLDVEKIKDVLNQRDNVNYGILYDVIMSSLYLRPPVFHWAEKNQLLWREIPEFISMMPNGKAILMIRDPRSILASFKLFTNASPPAYLGAIFNCLDAMQHGKKYLDEYPDNKVLLIKYEEAAYKPEHIARKIWQFIGLPEIEGINIYDTSTWVDAYNQPWRSNSSIQGEVKPFSFDIRRSINAWKNILTDDEISLGEHICGNVMEEFGYTLKNKTTDISNILETLKGDQQLNSFYNQWLATGQGVEAFPRDPLDPATWDRRPR